MNIVRKENTQNLILCRSVCHFFFVFGRWTSHTQLDTFLMWHLEFAYVCVRECFCFGEPILMFLPMDFRYKRWWTRRNHHQSVVSSEPNDINNEGNKRQGIFQLALISRFPFDFWPFFETLKCGPEILSKLWITSVRVCGAQNAKT